MPSACCARNARLRAAKPIARRTTGASSTTTAVISGQLVQQHPERVDVRRRIDVEPAQSRLLGTHVLRRPDELSVLGEQRLLGERLFDRLRNPEVDDFRRRRAVRLGHEDVRGLHIAVDDHDDRGVRILVFDIEHAHRFVKRISLWPPRPGEAVETVRGIAAHVQTRRLFISTVTRLAAIDLKTEKVVWQQTYDGHGCDRFAVSPDGRTIYAPAFGSPKWYVISATTGELLATIAVEGWPRDTRFSGWPHRRSRRTRDTRSARRG